MRNTALSALLALAAALPGLADANSIVIQNKGSDTLVNVAQAWAEEYKKVRPEVSVAVSGGGSGTGIAAVINGTVDLANSSREINPKEVQEAEAQGRHPKEFIVGYDALAIFIHKNNPIDSFTLEKLASFYRRDTKITKWSDIGVSIPGCPSDRIVVVSRQNNSGTYEYFKEAVLGKKGKYRLGTLDMHGSKDVVDLVYKTPCAIGYSGLAYATDEVKMVCVVNKEGKCIMPTVDNARSRVYPIARPLFMFTNGEPQGEIKSYLDWILSDTGQCIIADKGYAPVRDIKCPKRKPGAH